MSKNLKVPSQGQNKGKPFHACLVQRPPSVEQSCKNKGHFAVPAEEKAAILVQRAGACVGNSDLSLAVFKLGLQSCSPGAEFAHLDGNLFQRENPCVGRHGLEVRINGTKLMQP